MVLFLSGVISSSITEILKLWLRKRVKREGSDPLWWQGLFRLIPIILGGVMGNYFFLFPWGISVGASGGALSVVVYKKAKSLIQNMSGLPPS